MIAIMSLITHRLLALKDSELELRAGQVLFLTGEPVCSLYVVLEGCVQLVRHQANGAAVILQRAHANQLLAEASLFVP